MNVNFLGEAILGEEEARQRLLINLQALQWPEIEVISVKISTLYSQISALARDLTVAVLCERLELLYRTAARLSFTRADGTVVPKFVYLDMEEYRDMGLTAEAFMRTLERPGLENVAAGIVLQAYIPDSFRYQQEINHWARRRLRGGRSPVTLRVVKGANMEMERSRPPSGAGRRRPTPQVRDRRQLPSHGRRGMKPENIAAVRLGLASHNLFDLAYGLVQARRNGLLDKVQFEMLEGMANPSAPRALRMHAERAALRTGVPEGGLYLCHRLPDSATRREHRPGELPPLRLSHHGRTARLAASGDGLRCSLRGARRVSDAPRRTQNRQLPPNPSAAVARGWQCLVNEPDTDFSLPHNSDWAKQIVARWEPRHGEKAAEIPLVLAGEEILDGRPVRDCLDPSRPGVVVGRYRQAGSEDVDRAVQTAAADDGRLAVHGAR